MSLLQRASEHAHRRNARVIGVAPGWEAALTATGLAGQVVLGGGGELSAIPDGNRSFILPDMSVEVDGARWYVSAKGVGASTPMYGDPAGVGPRRFFGERWFGEAPFGGQGPDNAAAGLRLTARAGGATSWRGFAVCPVLQVVEVPEEETHRNDFWYRRHQGPVLQEHRLVPSDVRLFHAAPHTLGQDPERVLTAFGVDHGPDLDAFLENMIRTGVAALTVFARTAQVDDGQVTGLAYEHVWLDKDSVVAPNGSLHFADLEGVDAVSVPTTRATALITAQFEHNLYELMFGVDTVQRVHEHRVGRPLSIGDRRRKVAARFALALAGDPYVHFEARDGDLWLQIRPASSGLESVDLCLFNGVK